MVLSSDRERIYACGGGSLYVILLDGFEGGSSEVDEDGDGIPNIFDAFPSDPAASNDTDHDGYPGEWNPGKNEMDSTTGLELDIFPSDPNEWADSDSDSIGNNGDRFPMDPAAWEDTDGDGYPDRWNPGKSEADSTTGLKLDEFPMDSTEWSDLDGDGTGDNSDEFPVDPGEWIDSDKDGSGNNGDAFPVDPAASVDSDGDGYPDRWNPGMSEADSITGLEIDHYPLDPKRHTDEGSFIDDPIFIYVPIILLTLLVILLLAVLMIARSRRSSDQNLTEGERHIQRYRNDILMGIGDDDFDMSDEEILEVLSKKNSSRSISRENYSFIIENILEDR
jgi:hypothetical protein